jgi:hypothetical protein
MCKAGILLLSLWCAWTAGVQGVRTAPHKLSPTNKPACSQGAVCFSGEVSVGNEFRKKELNSQLDFVLKPTWTIAIGPKRKRPPLDEWGAHGAEEIRSHAD